MNPAESPRAEASPRRAAWRIRRGHAYWLMTAFLVVAIVRMRWFSGATAASSPDVNHAEPEVSAASQPPDEESVAPQPVATRRELMLGSWRDQFYGERTMTFHADGTGTMVIKLDAIGQAIYGEKLQFDLAWENRAGVLVMTFTGGEPKDAVATISKLWGTTHEQQIERLTDSELQLKSTDSSNVYTLERLPEPGDLPAE